MEVSKASLGAIAGGRPARALALHYPPGSTVPAGSAKVNSAPNTLKQQASLHKATVHDRSEAPQPQPMASRMM
ncbi:hypothetical protein NDU88_005087 [Pleurodeles waltl]|uniref:Uncharacterized protein n=1 Tax=Pleurodeles waltl TaxID=8319 RepID=A0AAV7SKN4_PLEWA|nr:hypothetical protein NDU88_005087 [Pleurodeles waltl]